MNFDLDTEDIRQPIPPFTKDSAIKKIRAAEDAWNCLLYTSPSPRDKRQSRMPSSA